MVLGRVEDFTQEVEDCAAYKGRHAGKVGEEETTSLSTHVSTFPTHPSASGI